MNSDLNALLVEVLRIPSDQLADELTMQDVEEWDSLRQMELIVAVEETFQIELSGDDIANMASISGIRKTVESKVGAA
ncbi:MAG: acyl carrier protein [Bdellovibrionales bacterium]|nr:acyl carrier protein [Bdellovibrionales bacterium]